MVIQYRFRPAWRTDNLLRQRTPVCRRALRARLAVRRWHACGLARDCWIAGRLGGIRVCAARILREAIMRPAMSKTFSKLFLLATIALLSAFTFGQRSKNADPGSGPGKYQDRLKDEAFIKEGAAIFIPSCSSTYCHGSAGMGGSAPRLRGRDL